jgi:hypothetical protein
MNKFTGSGAFNVQLKQTLQKRVDISNRMQPWELYKTPMLVEIAMVGLELVVEGTGQTGM